MKLRVTPGGLIAEDTARGRWARLPDEGDLLSFLSGGREAVARAQDAMADAPTADPAEAVLPFRPRSIRAFMLWEQHVIALEPDAGQALLPGAGGEGRRSASSASPAGRSRSSSRTSRFCEAPTFYVANHTSVLGRRPGHVVALAHQVPRLRARARVRAGPPLVDATPEEARRRRRRLVRPQRLERARRAGRRRPAQRLRTGHQVQDVRQLDRLRRRDRRRVRRLDSGDRPRPGRRRAVVRGRHRRPAARRSARCSPTPRRASSSTPAT